MPRTRAGVGLPSPPTPKGPIPTAHRPPTTPTNVQPRRKNCELDVNLRTQITTLKEVAKWPRKISRALAINYQKDLFTVPNSP